MQFVSSHVWCLVTSTDFEEKLEWKRFPSFTYGQITQDFLLHLNIPGRILLGLLEVGGGNFVLIK